MQRVIVIGSGGAGKSTFAAKLGAGLALPVIHLDREFWRAGWIEPPKEEWAARVRELCAQPRWVMDGNYGGTLEARIAASDTIVFLDLPRWLCLIRVLRRNMRYLGRARPDMNPGCPERVPQLKFLRWIWDYPATRRPRLIRMLEGIQTPKRVVILSSRNAVSAFLRSIEQPGKSNTADSDPGETIVRVR
jgi:adenylate kinase family enzyme